MNSLNTKKIAIGGVLLALSVAMLFGATFVPGIELTLYTLSSVCVAIMILEFSPGAGLLLYFASVMLSFALVPNKAGIIPYTIFFGIYAVVKYYIENYRKLPRPVEIILKLIFCNSMFFVGVRFFGALFTSAVQIPDMALPIILIGAQVFFLAYDYLLTLVISFYLRRRPKAQQ